MTAAAQHRGGALMTCEAVTARAFAMGLTADEAIVLLGWMCDAAPPDMDKGLDMIAARRAGQTVTAPPPTTMRDVRDGDTIRLDGRLIDVGAIERGTVAYIQPTAGPEFHTALDAPVAILHRADSAEVDTNA